MLMSLLIGAAALSADLPLVFLSPGDLQNAQNVHIAVQVSEPPLTLLPKDSTRPSLWYFPVAALPVNDEIWVWYQRVNKAESGYSDQRTLCLGRVTATGLEPIDAGGAPPSWGGVNNVVFRRSPHKPTWGGFNVFQILRSGDGFKMLYWDQPAEGNAGAMLAESADGIHWTPAADEKAVFTEHNDAYTLLQTDDRLLLYQTKLDPWPDKPYPDNLDKYKRVISLRESKDWLQWTPQAPLLAPDAQDKPETEFYYMKAFPYARRYAALIMKYYADPAKPNLHSALLMNELAVSDDACAWERPFRETEPGFWSMADPFEFGGKLNFVAHQDAAIVMHQYRKNGLTAVEAGADAGTFHTKPFHAGSQGLALNAICAADGFVEVELLGANGDVLATPRRFEGPLDEQALPLYTPEELQMLNGSKGALKIAMKNTKLFAVAPAIQP